MADDLRGLDAPHPRERDILVGHAAAADALITAERAGRLHHAWLVGGRRGIGKATLAYRFARWLLAPAGERREGGDGLGVDPDGRTTRQVSAGSHPNLMTIERVARDGEKGLPKTIGVDAVRRALMFFATTAADGGRRICIVDSADDLNLSGANALLKTIEEPPRGGLILLVSHMPMRVLPTIRSRCGKLALEPLSTGDVERVVRSVRSTGDGQERDLVAEAARLSDGSVSQALALLESKRLLVLNEVAALLDALPNAPTGRVLALADRVADKARDDVFGLTLDAVQRWLAERVRASQGLGAARLAPLAIVCENLTEAARSVETFNLDKRAFIVSTFGELAEAVRRSA